MYFVLSGLMGVRLYFSTNIMYLFRFHFFSSLWKKLTKNWTFITRIRSEATSPHIVQTESNTFELLKLFIFKMYKVRTEISPKLTSKGQLLINYPFLLSNRLNRTNCKLVYSSYPLVPIIFVYRQLLQFVRFCLDDMYMWERGKLT